MFNMLQWNMPEAFNIKVLHLSGVFVIKSSIRWWGALLEATHDIYSVFAQRLALRGFAGHFWLCELVSLELLQLYSWFYICFHEMPSHVSNLEAYYIYFKRLRKPSRIDVYQTLGFFSTNTLNTLHKVCQLAPGWWKMHYPTAWPGR
jgi:hypothetical protein